MWSSARLWFAALVLVSGCGDNAGKPRDGGADAVGDAGGDGAPPADPCTGPTDPQLVLAPQRLVHLTKRELVNTVRALLGDEAALAIVADPAFSDLSNETSLRVPLLASLGESDSINSDPDSFPMLNDMAQVAAKFVLDNFEAATGCSAGDDACAFGFVRALAPRAFRRTLSGDEDAGLAALYEGSKSQIVNGWRVSGTIEEATRNAVYALLAAPQTLWRSEIGDPAAAGPAPGVPLTDSELATALAYFLTGSPPDAELAAAAAGGALREDLDAETVRLLGTPAAQSWLSTVMFTVYGLNRIYETRVDTDKFPEIAGNMLQDMHDEAKLFVQDTLWNRPIEDLLLSRTSFVNAPLASTIYKIPVPAGATDTSFVRVTLPAAERSGLLTNAAFITSQAGADVESLIYRAVFIDKNFLCLSTDSFPEEFRDLVAAAKGQFEMETEQEQASYRRSRAACNRCHQTFDAYGLSLDGYDNIGRVRTSVSLSDGRVTPVDAHTDLPAVLGGGAINGAIDLAKALAGSELYPQCMVRNVLQHAMAELGVYVDFPIPPEAVVDPETTATPGCAVREATARYLGAGGRTFSDIVRAVVASPAFSRRNLDPTGGGPPNDAGLASAGEDLDGAADSVSAEAGSSDDAGPGVDAGSLADGGAGSDAGDAGGAPSAPDALKTIVLRRTVLSYVLGELARLRQGVPPLAQGRLDLHADAVRAVTSSIDSSIRNVGPPPGAN